MRLCGVLFGCEFESHRAPQFGLDGISGPFCKGALNSSLAYMHDPDNVEYASRFNLG